MLLAAVILGLIGGISYFIGGAAGTVAEFEDYMGHPLDTPWWVIPLIPIGVVGTIGGALVRWRPSLAGVLLLLAAASSIVIGIISFDEAISQEGMNFFPPVVTTHPFAGSLGFPPIPLFALIIAGALAFAGRKRPSMPAPTNMGGVITAFLKELLR